MATLSPVTIAVRKRIEIDGYGSWSIKAGDPSRATACVGIQSILTPGIHLDLALESNGALRVLPAHTSLSGWTRVRFSFGKNTGEQ